MTVRQRWWIDAVVVIGSFLAGMALWDAGLFFMGSALGFTGVAAVTWGRKRWPPPPIERRPDA